MPELSAASVESEGRRLVQLLRHWAGLLAVAVALLPSIVYLERIIDHDGREFGRALDRRVQQIAALAYAESRLWRFELHRIKDILEPNTVEPWRTSFTVEVPEYGGWVEIAAVDERPMGPTLTLAAPIIDNGREIGRITGTRDINHILIDVVAVVAVSVALGAAVLLLIRTKVIPFVQSSLLRIAANEREISTQRDALTDTVRARTAALSLANERLRESLEDLERREIESRDLAAIARSVRSAIVILAADATITWANPAFTELTGWTVDEVTGKKPGRLFDGPDTDPATVARIRESWRHARPYTEEIAQYMKSGEKRWLEASATMVTDAAGRVERCILIGKDITGRKSQQAQVDAALEREREIYQHQRRFVSVVSHEFRTPLTIIDGAAQRLARNADRHAPADVRERVDKIRRAVARMGELIETTLSAARLDSGAVDVKAAAVDLAAMLTGVVERIRSIAAEFEITLDLPATPAIVSGDARLLDQVLTNLLTNAVKYSGSSRRIELALGAGDGQAYVSISDHGLGIPADELPKLFTRFYRASTAQGLPGTGIGLNLARDLVAMHGGEITVASEVGLGSTFTVRLPLAATASEAVPVRAA